MHKDNFVVGIATSKGFLKTIILKHKQNINTISEVSLTWAITDFLYGKCVSKLWDTNFIITIS